MTPCVQGHNFGVDYFFIRNNAWYDSTLLQINLFIIVYFEKHISG